MYIKKIMLCLKLMIIHHLKLCMLLQLKEKKNKYLSTYCTNLTERAKKGELDNIIGRDRELGRVVQILSRRSKNNPCLIGEPGVGKTAIA